MPFINIKTNREVNKENSVLIKTALGKDITALPGKSEMWLMISVEDNCNMYFRGTDEPAAMVQVSIYGNAPSDAKNELTSRITNLLSSTLDISPDRIYVSYASTPDWGWNGSNL